MRFLLGLAAVVPLAAAAAPPPAAEVLAAEKQLAEVTDTVGPSVACVVVSRSDRYPKPETPPAPGRLGGFDPVAFLDRNPTEARAREARRLDLADPDTIPDNAYAGGVVIDAAGLVLTTWHATDGATKIYVHLGGGRGSYADVHAADSRTDFAVLKLLTPPAGLKPVRLGGDPSRPRPAFGTLAVLLTRPYTAGPPVLAPPAVGALGTILRRRPAESKADYPVYDLGDLLEYTATGGFGVGGGALFNRDGELIGLSTTTAAVTGEGGPGYALPIDPAARRVIGVLAAGREVESGFLGINLPMYAATNGVPVEALVPQGPAAAAGLKTGDVIVRVNETPVTGQADLHLALRSAIAGERSTVAVRRGGQTREFDLYPGKAANTRPFIASARPEPVSGLLVDFNTPLLQRQDRQRPGGIPPGVVVRELVPDSPAAARFKALGDAGGSWLVTHVDGNPVPTPAAFYKAAKGKPSVKLTVLDPLTPGATPKDITLP